MLSSHGFFGREAELAALLAKVSAAQDGVPSLTVLVGDAGVGKTRLACEAAERSREQGARAARGACVELSGGEIPYAPLAGALSEVDPDTLRHALTQLGPLGHADLARAFPAVIPADPDAPAPVTHDGRLAQPRLFEWLLALVRRLCEDAPLLLTIEDLHWADVSSRDFLLFLARRMRDERLALLVTVRSDELHPDHPVELLAARLASSDAGSRLPLGSLTAAATERLIAAILGHEPPPELMRRILERGEGNPFYTEELLAATAGADADAELPDTLRDALLLRVRARSRHAQEVMRVVAAVRRPAQQRLIEAAAELHARDVRAALRECVDHRLLVCDRQSHRFELRHPLLREAVYADLLPAERSDLHHAIARALDAEGGRAVAAERAHHWEAAGEARAAVLAAVEAGMAAEEAYAYAEALAQFERAARLWPAGAPDPGEARLDRVDTLARAAEAARATGDSDRAQMLCRQALVMLDHRSDRLRAAELLERLGLHEHFDLATLQRALALLSERDVPRWMSVKANIAMALNLSNRWAEARASACEALRHAGEPGTEAAESAARSALGFAMAFLGDLAGAEAQLRRALRLAQRVGDPTEIAQVLAELGEVLRLQGRVQDALELMLEGESLAVRFAARGIFGDLMVANACDDLLRLGRWPEVQQRLQPLLQSAMLTPTAELMTAIVAGRLHTARGEFDSASASLHRAVALLEEVKMLAAVPQVYAGYAELDMWNGRTDRAVARIGAALEQVRGVEDALNAPAVYSLAARAEADLAEQARFSGRHAEDRRAEAAARASCDQLAAVLARTRYSVPPPEAAAHLANCRAEVTRASGKSDPEAWGTAVALWRALDFPYATAYALYRQGEALLSARGGRPRARDLLTEAQNRCVQLAARPLLHEVQALAHRARCKLPAPRDTPCGDEPPVTPPTRALFDLTARELEVLRLLGTGLTNRQIAETLCISPHTAGVHVAHILGKLDVSNRAAAAAAAQRLGLI